METFKGKVRQIFGKGERVLVARNHSIGDLANSIPGLRVGDVVLCNERQTIQKIENTT